MRISLDQSRAARFFKEGAADIRGKKISYKVISEDTYFDLGGGEQNASFFSYSYFRTDVDDCSSRPVIFVFNGGPGSGSIWLHVGFFGIDRIKYQDAVNPPAVPPYEAEANPHCLLDIADIVLIDPFGTGYSDVREPDALKEYLSTSGDALAFALFIEHWLSKYDRWNSPRFTCGESYGTLRSAMLADTLFCNGDTLRAISLNGIIMLGPILNIFHYGPAIHEKSLTDLLCMAATNHYHHPEGKPSFKQFTEEAHRFSTDEYLRALYVCNMLTAEERAHILERLSYYTGIEPEYFEEHNLRIDMEDFIRKIVPGRVVGLYDSRYTLPKADRIGKFSLVPDDGAMGKYTPSYVGVFNCHFKKSLNIDFERPYIPITWTLDANWDWSVSRDPVESLAAAMRRNEKLHVLWGTGYYDLCTTPGSIRHLIAQSGMPLERVTRREYPSGHMPYIGDESSALMEADIREFISNALRT